MFLADVQINLPSTIQIGAMQTILGIALILLGAGVAWGKLNSSVNTIREDLKDAIKPDLKDVRDRLSLLEGKTSNMFNRASPIKLTEKGSDILDKSAFKSYIDSNVELLSAACGKDRSMDNPYDVQQSAFEFFDEYQFPDDVDSKLKTYAYNAGISMDVLRRIGAIYFRDKCLNELGFTPEQIDGHSPDQKKQQ